MIEAQQANAAAPFSGGLENRNGIGSRAEPDIPNNEFPTVLFEAIEKEELFNVQSLSLGNRPDDRMESLRVRKRMDAMRAAGELDDAISGRICHLKNVAEVDRFLN
jgi:hypothetical protein